MMVAMPAVEGEMVSWGRLLLDGIPFADMLEAQRRDAGIRWFDFWMRKAAFYEELGEQCIAEEHELSAGQWLWLASLCCQYGKAHSFDEGRWEGQRRKVELYRLAAPYLAPPAERVEVPLDFVVIPGFLRLPAHGSGPHACAMLLGGLDSTKEESYLFENLLLERGVATFTFDGPGQGEMLEDLPLRGDFHRFSSAVMDRLVARPEIDGDRVGVLGRSVGGHYALQTACHDDRFAACVSWGGFVDMDAWDVETELSREAWRYATKTATEEEAREIAQRALDVRPVLDRLRCPTYVLHGALDQRPLDQVRVLQQLAVNSELTVVVEPVGDHCCHNLGPAPRVRMADWLAKALA